MYTMEYFSAVKNKIVSSAEKWMETLMHVEQDQPNLERQILHVFSQIWNLDLKIIIWHDYKRETVKKGNQQEKREERA
jgi:hypothetical protein